MMSTDKYISFTKFTLDGFFMGRRFFHLITINGMVDGNGVISSLG